MIIRPSKDTLRRVVTINNKDSEDMKIPFEIKFRPQIESGEYKVETFSGYPVTIYRWDFYDGAQTPIMGSYVFEDGKEYVGAWNDEGHFEIA